MVVAPSYTAIAATEAGRVAYRVEHKKCVKYAHHFRSFWIRDFKFLTKLGYLSCSATRKCDFCNGFCGQHSVEDFFSCNLLHV